MVGALPPNLVRSARHAGNAVLNFGLFRIAAGNWDGADLVLLSEPGPVVGSRAPCLLIHARNNLTPFAVAMAAPGSGPPDGGPGTVVAVTVGAAVVSGVVADEAFDDPLLEHAARLSTAIPVTMTTSCFDMLESDHSQTGTSTVVSPGSFGSWMTEHQYEVRCACGARWLVLLDDTDDEFEPKLDGWRALAYVDGVVTVRTGTGTGRDITDRVDYLQGLADLGRRLVLDGELVAEAGRAGDFYRLGPNLRSSSRKDITFVAFDVLVLDDENLCDRPCSDRHRLLEELDLFGPGWFSIRALEGPSRVLLDACAVLLADASPSAPCKRLSRAARAVGWQAL